MVAAWSRATLGWAAWYEGDLAQARADLEAGASESTELGDRFGLSMVFAILGFVLVECDDRPAALELADRVEATCRGSHPRMDGLCACRGRVALSDGDLGAFSYAQALPTYPNIRIQALFIWSKLNSSKAIPTRPSNC